MQEERRKIVMSQEHYCTGLPMIMVISKIFQVAGYIMVQVKIFKPMPILNVLYIFLP